MPVNKYPVVQLADSNANLIDPATGTGGGSGSTTQRATLAEGGGTTSGTAGTASQVVAADANRKKFEFQNLGTATIVLRVNVGADTTVAATGTPTTKRMIAVPAGQLYVTEADTLCTGLVSVASGTASVPYSYLAS